MPQIIVNQDNKFTNKVRALSWWNSLSEAQISNILLDRKLENVSTSDIVNLFEFYFRSK